MIGGIALSRLSKLILHGCSPTNLLDGAMPWMHMMDWVGEVLSRWGVDYHVFCCGYQIGEIQNDHPIWGYSDLRHGMDCVWGPRILLIGKKEDLRLNQMKPLNSRSAVSNTSHILKNIKTNVAKLPMMKKFSCLQDWLRMCFSTRIVMYPNCASHWLSLMDLIRVGHMTGSLSLEMMEY